jgi:Tol biopolymer transport system component
MDRNRTRALATTAAMLVGLWGASGATAHAATTAAPAKAVNGTIVTGTFDDGPQWVCALAGTSPTTGTVTALTATGVGCDPAASPDGTRLSYIGAATPDTTERAITTPLTLHVMDSNGTHSRVVYRLPNTHYTLTGAIFTPDGQHLVFGVRNLISDTSALYRIGTNGKGLTGLDLGFEKTTSIQPEAYSPDGRTLAVSLDGGSSLWMKTGNAKPYQPRLAVEPKGGVSFSPDGKELAYSDGGSDYLADLATGRATLIAAGYQDDGHNQHLFGAATFSPDGTRIALLATEMPWGAMGGFFTTLETVEVAHLSTPVAVSPQKTDGETDTLVWLPAHTAR